MDTVDVRGLEREAGEGEAAVPCPACGGQKFEALLSPEEVEAERRWLRRFYRWRVTGDEDELEDRTAFTQSEPTHIVRCLACGTVLRDPRPTPDALRELYAHDTYGPEALEALARNQEAFDRGKAENVRADLPAGAKILEVGPFVGGFLSAAGRLRWRATGVDVGAETVAFMRGRGLDVIHGDLLEVDLPDGAWDAIFIWNTFDQLPDPAAVLDRAFSLLREGGRLVLRVPNGDFETACLRLRESAGAARAAHVRRAQAYNNFLTFPYLNGYTPDALHRLLDRHGFRVERIVGDTILTLADETTRPCAVAEEARVKRAVMRSARAALSATGRQYAPWLDVHATRAR